MPWQKDLIVIGADADVLALVRTIVLQRAGSLGIRLIGSDKADFLKDVLHDSSPPSVIAELLRPCLRSHHRAVVIRDLEGSGFADRAQLEQEIRSALERNGWDADRIEVIVIEPEVEAWLRFPSAPLAQLVRDNKRIRTRPIPNVRRTVQQLIVKHGGEVERKPTRPKEVFEELLDAYRIPRSASLYEDLAKKESLHDCTVPSFLKFIAALKRWFPV